MTRGTWQGSGTFQTSDDGAMTGVLALVGVGVLAASVLEWVVAHAWEIIAVTGGCGVLAVVGAIALLRWTGRREATGALVYKAAFDRQREALAAAPKPQLTQGTVPAIEYHVHHHHHYADSREPSRIIAGEVSP